MYKIEIPNTVHQLMGIFYVLKMWSDTTTLGGHCRKICYFIYFVAFVLSLAVGAYTTADKDECVFLAVVLLMNAVLAYKMWIILWEKNGFLSLVNEIGKHSTKDQEEFSRINEKLNVLMKFCRYFLLVLLIATFFATVVFPITSEKHLLFNIAFPFDRTNSKIAFWMASVFLFGGFFCGIVCIILTKIVRYLMLSITFEYKILGNQLRRMGTSTQTGSPHLKVSLAAQQQLFHKDFIVAIKKYDKINGTLEDFASYFGNLFFLQIATGSVCICGSVYTLAFSSHDNLIQDGIYCVVLAYSIFDIFTVMYLGNEIKLSSDELSQCVYESNWIEQTESCKKCIIILMERLKRPQELIVWKLYPLNLLTFTSIVNTAYSMFNILQNFR